MTSPSFNLDGPSGAVLSPDQRHRYWLWRRWDRSKPFLVVAMFNPSTANAQIDDPTISRLCKWAKRWGYGGVLVINIYSLRSPDPAIIRDDPRRAFGDAQPAAIGQALALASEQGTPLLVAWGNLASPADTRIILDAAEDLDLICLGTTKDGRPKHPMARGQHRVPDEIEPMPWPR